MFLFILSFFTSVEIIQLPDGDLKWTNIYPTDAKMCIPAMFTSPNQEIEGTYILDGRVYNDNSKLKVSLKNDTFFISTKWLSDNGFQQLSLVKNGKLRMFKDTRRFIRRALCKNNGKMFLIQSRFPLTLSQFAKECQKYSSDAVYLDTGSYGYGYVGNRRLFLWAYFNRKKQTNWLVIC